jgi:hypothetical protein
MSDSLLQNISLARCQADPEVKCYSLDRKVSAKRETLKMNRLRSIAVASVVTAAGMAVFTTFSGHAETCTPLRVIGGSGTQVQKTVSAPGAGLVARNNWNTDFAVLSTASFARFVTTVVPKNEGQYKIQVALKYNNDSVDKVFDQTVTLRKNQPYRITGASRNNAYPYQVNVFVGGIPVVGNTYTVSVAGCN